MPQNCISEIKQAVRMLPLYCLAFRFISAKYGELSVQTQLRHTAPQRASEVAIHHCAHKCTIFEFIRVHSCSALSAVRPSEGEDAA